MLATNVSQLGANPDQWTTISAVVFGAPEATPQSAKIRDLRCGSQPHQACTAWLKLTAAL